MSTAVRSRELDILTGAAQRIRGFLAAAEARIARRRAEIWHRQDDHDHDDGDIGDDDHDERSPDAAASLGSPAGSVDSLDEQLADQLANLGDRRSASDRERNHARARTGDSMPSFEEALAAGEIDIGHVDAIGAALAQLADEAQGLTWDRLQVESLRGLVSSSAAVEPRVPELIVIVDRATLMDGTFDHDCICETSTGAPLPPDTARRLACDAEIIPVGVGPDGVPFDHGRTRRLASRKHRRALRLMYRTWGHPDCHVAFDRCRIHHVTWWECGGTTDLQNLLPLCSRHHHQVHEGGWTLTMSATASPPGPLPTERSGTPAIPAIDCPTSG